MTHCYQKRNSGSLQGFSIEDSKTQETWVFFYHGTRAIHGLKY
jgi:hypothetical protein